MRITSASASAFSYQKFLLQKEHCDNQKEHCSDICSRVSASPLVTDVWNKKCVYDADVSMILNMMSDEQLALYKEAFQTYDKQKNGTIRLKALVKVLRTLGENPTEDKIEGIILQLASKGKIHVIDFIDFLRIMYDVTNGCCFSVDEVIQEAFNMFDTDAGGSITHDEFRQKMLSSGADIELDEVDEIIAEVDINQDGVIDLEEFAMMIKHMW